MRLESHDNKKEEYKIWLTPEEKEQLVNQVSDLDKIIVLRLMSDCGLRVGEIETPTVSDLQPGERGGHGWLRVRGKDTSGGEKKSRTVYVPRDLFQIINAHTSDKEGSQPLLDKNRRQCRYVVEKSRESAAETTGNDDWQHLSSHDLRRFWAHDLLVRQRINPRVVMAIGGWSSYDAIEPYLSEPTEEIIVEEMNRSGNQNPLDGQRANMGQSQQFR